MGNLFSRRPQQYHKMEESIIELDTILHAYDNRLTVCERESIKDKKNIYELEKQVKILTNTIKNYDNKILESTNNMETQINGTSYNVKKLEQAFNIEMIEKNIIGILNKKFDEKEKWQFELMNKYIEITYDFDKFKEEFEKESQILAKDGKIVDNDITSHYTALCYICYKINSNILENYFK